MNRVTRLKVIELKKLIWKKEDYVGKLWRQLDTLKIRSLPYAPPEKEHKSLHNRLFKNIEDLKGLKLELKKLRGW